MIKTVKDFDFKGVRALIRVDFNVPLNDKLQVTDASRIEATAPTIEKIIKDGGSVVLMSHFGRPKKELQSVTLGAENEFSLKHILSTLTKIIGQEVDFVDDCCSEEAFSKSKNLKSGEILLLENLRFYEDEKKGFNDFAQMLSQHGQVYVNDAFGTAHRAHASTAVVANYFPKDQKMFGLLMAKEIENADKVLKNAEQPFTAILGGAKVSDKIQIIENLLQIANHIIIGGGMAYTFFKATGGQIGNSLVEEDKLDLAFELLAKAKANNVNIVLPSDSVIANKFANNADIKSAENENIPEGWMGLDIGDQAIRDFSSIIQNSKTILWNGPMGVFEMENFQSGTRAVAEAIAEATKNGAFSLVGGGDSVAAINKFNFHDKVSYVSTGGGAMLEYFEGKQLPGIAAITG